MNVRTKIHDLYRNEKPQTPAEFWAAGGCLAFPGKVAKAITGTDPTEAFRAQFDTEEGAKQTMIVSGCASMKDAAALAYAEIPVAEARPGDWAIVPNPDGADGLGVVMGSQVVVPTPRGLGTVLLTRASSAFRVA